MFRSLRWRIAIPLVVLILVSLGGLSAYLLHSVKSNYLDTTSMGSTLKLFLAKSIKTERR